jgi:hypothetical protein
MAALYGAATGGAGGVAGGIGKSIPLPYGAPAPGGMTGDLGQSVLPPGPTPDLGMGPRMANQAVGAIGPIGQRAASMGAGMGMQQAMAPSPPQPASPYSHMTPYWAR